MSFTSCEMAFDFVPEDVENYEEKFKKTRANVDAALSDYTVHGLVMLSESVTREIKKKSKKVDKILSCLITINAKSEIKFEDLKRKTEKVITKKWIKNYFYCYEQRSEDPKEFKGFHTHLLVRLAKKKYKFDIIREVFNTCKTICTKNAINVRFLKTEKDYTKVRDYILGNKSTEKEKKLKVDEVFREKFGLSAYYEGSG